MEASNEKNREMGWALGVDGRRLTIEWRLKTKIK
jgi:hypothetical protein